MATTRDSHDGHGSRRHQARIEVLPIPETMPTEELRRRERELERLIILAACRRAARQAAPARPAGPADDAAAAAGG